MTTPTPTVIELARKMAEDCYPKQFFYIRHPLVQALIAAIELGERRGRDAMMQARKDMLA